MKTGSILHHKYFNGVVKGKRQDTYQKVVLKLFDRYGMFGSGMMKFVTRHGLDAALYQLSDADCLVEFCRQNRLDIHYNTVLTGRINAMPDSYKLLSRNEKIEFLETYVRYIVDRYRGKVSFYKLVNEITNEPEEDYLGTGFAKGELLAKVFRWATDTYPEGKYMINEHAVIIREEVRKAFLRIVNGILDQGSRIDLIGLQGHMGYFPRFTFLPPDDYVIDSLTKVKQEFQLPIFITEFDVNSGQVTDQQVECDGKVYPDWYAYQKYAYCHFPKLLEKSGLVEEFYYWSLVDDPELVGEKSDVGLFTKDFESKGYMERVLG